MLSLEYIRIRKDRPLEQRLASIWCAACHELNIPCVLVYLNDEDAYISANLSHLPETPDLKEKTHEVQQKLACIQYRYTGSEKGYWSHNHGYFTFDCIPRDKAQEAAGTIFQVIKSNLPATKPTSGL